MQESNPGSLEQNRQLPECVRTNWAIEDQAKSLNSIACPYDEKAFSPLVPTPDCILHRLWRYTCSFLLTWLFLHRQAILKSKGDKLFSSAECRIWIRVFGTECPADWMPTDKPTELSRIKLKTWTQQPVPMIHSTPLPSRFRTWLWRYTCLLLLNLMLLHRQAIFKSIGDKLFSSAECRIWTRVFGTECPADWMPTDKPTELSRIKLKTWTQQPAPMISENSTHSPHCHLAFAPGSGDIHVCCC